MFRGIKISFTSTLFISMVLIIFISFGSISWIWFKYEYERYSSEAKKIKERLINDKKNFIKTEVDWIQDHIEYKKTLTNLRLKTEIKKRTNTAHGIASSIYNSTKESLPRKDIENTIIETLRNMRFAADKRGYYFIVSMNGIEKLFADKPEMEGKNLTDFKNKNNTYVIRDMINLVKQYQEGYYGYQWTKPNSTGEQYPKIAYIKFFEPFDWIIGAGEYPDEVEKDIRKEVIHWIKNLKNSDLIPLKAGEVQVATNSDKYSHNSQDIQGFRNHQENINNKCRAKISYTTIIEDWNIYISNETSLDEIYSRSIKEQSKVKEDIRSFSSKILPLIAACMLLIILIAKSVAWSLKKNIENFSGFFMNSSPENLIDTNKITFKEFLSIANYANQMNKEKNSLLTSLLETKEWLETILNSVNTGVMVIKKGKKEIIDVNKAAEKIISAPKRKIVGKKPELYFEDRDISVFDTRPYFEHESLILRPDGEKIPVLITKSITEIANLEFLIINFADITEKKSLETSIRHSQKMEAIGTLAGGIAHEFNNILGIMIGYCDLAIEKVPESNPAKRHLNEIEKAGMRAKNIILQLLSFSRSKGEYKQPINIIPTIKESLKLIRPSIPANIKISTDFEPEPYTILGDHSQINQAIINLCTNSYHAMTDNGGQILLTIKNHDSYGEKLNSSATLHPGKYLKITISDSGTGIPEEITHKIFDPYFTTKDFTENSGMGLAVVHGIVKSHKGTIDVQSIHNKGTEINIYFPSISNSMQNKIKTEKNTPAQGNESILFIDDEESIVDIAKTELEILGYKVTALSSPIDAYDEFQKNPDRFDLVVTDMSMPELTGIELTKKIRQINAKTKIVICSGSKDKVNKKIAGEFSIDDFLMKPYRPESLAIKIREVLEEKAENNSENY